MPATRTPNNAAASSSSNAPSASPEPQGYKDLPERSRNAKAQARHREKRKAYISHLEQSVSTLKQQLSSMGISGATSSSASSSSSAANAETDIRLRELVEENERLKNEINKLRARVELVGGGGGGRSSARLTPPLTPGGSSVLGGLGMLPMPDEALDGATHSRRATGHGAGSVESFLEGNGAQNHSSFSSLSSSSHQVPLSLNLPSHNGNHRPLSAGAANGMSHLAQHRYSLPSPLPSSLSSSSSSSTPLLPPPGPSASPYFHGHNQHNFSHPHHQHHQQQHPGHFRVQSPFGTPVDPSSGWQIPRNAPTLAQQPAFGADFPRGRELPSMLAAGSRELPFPLTANTSGRELPLPAGFGLTPLSMGSGSGSNNSNQGGYDYLMVSAVRGSTSNSGPLATEFPSAVPPLTSAFYSGSNDGPPSAASSATLPPFSATSATSTAFDFHYGNQQHQSIHQQQQQQSSAPASRANSQSRAGTGTNTRSSNSSSPRSLSHSPVTVPFLAAPGAGGSPFGLAVAAVPRSSLDGNSGAASEFAAVGQGSSFDFGLAGEQQGGVGREQWT